jgi:sugar lactone lactonase YvrE
MTRRVLARAVWPLLALLIAGLCLSAASAGATLPAGQLAQLPGTAGCFTFDGQSEDGPATCGIGRAMSEGESAVVSPDSRNVYVGSYPIFSPARRGSLVVFARTPTGELSQLPGTAGCFTTDGASADGPGTCTKARGLVSAPGDGRDLALTSDGLWAYLTAQNHDSTGVGSVLIFTRDPSTGALTQLPGSAGCISADGSSQDGPANCQTDATLAQPMGVTMSSDNRFLYVTDYGTPHRLHVYSRDPSSGALTASQCVAEAPAPAGCGLGRVVGNSQSVAITPDGQHLYAGTFENGMSIFNRDPSTGLLLQKPGTDGCVTDDGKDNTTAATCATGRNLDGVYPVTLSQDGRTLYNMASIDGGVTVWRVNGDGTLSQLPGSDGCITIDGKDNTGASTCSVGRAVTGPYGAALSPDGRQLYTSEDTNLSGGLAAFSVDPASGVLAQPAGLPGCFTVNGGSGPTAGLCTDARALADAYGMSVSPDGAFVYQSSDAKTNAGLAIYSRGVAPTCSPVSAAVPHGRSAAVSLTCTDLNGDAVTRSIVSGPAHGRLGAVSGGTVTYTPSAGYHGADSFAFAGSDGVNPSAPATATLTVATAFRGARLRGRILTFAAKGNFKIKVSCPANAPSGRCTEVASLYSAKGTIPRSAAKKRPKAVLLAKARFSVKAGKSVTKKMRLNKAGRKLGRAHQHFRARLRLRSTSGAGTVVRQTINVTLKRAKARR